MKQRRDDLIYVNVTGDRHGGSAVDYTINPAIGFADITGRMESDQPTNAVLPAWDNIAGQMAATSVLAAERHRRLTGQGNLIKLALKDVALATAGHLGNLAEVQINDHDREKVGNYLYGAFGRDFLSKDGKRLMVVGLTGRQWSALIQASDQAIRLAELETDLNTDFSQEGNRYQFREEIAAILEPFFATHSYQALVALLDEYGVCWGPYQTFRQLLDSDPDCSEDNPLFSSMTQPGIGTFLVPGSPMRFSAGGNVPPMLAPALGQHTDEVLADMLGLSAGEIGRLHDDGVVAGVE